MCAVKWNEVCDNFDTCALAGAAAFAAGIPKSHVLVNGPLWCYFYAKGHLKRSAARIMDNMTGSQPENDAVIFGSEQYLTKEIKRLMEQEKLQPSLLFVENSCAFSLIGDDNEGILKSLELPFPALSLDCGGIIGGFAEGFTKACELVIKKLCLNNQEKKNLSVNLLGASEFYLNGKADIKEIRRILELAGYQVNCIPGGGSTLEEIQNLSKAQLNIVIHEELGLKTAQYLKEAWDMPYVVAGVPYGLGGTQAWLERISKVLKAPTLVKVEEEIRETKLFLDNVIEDFACYWGNLWYDQVIVAATGTQALCLAQALRSEWFNMGKLTVLCLKDVQENIYCDTADLIVTKDVDLEQWQQYIPKEGEVLLLGSGSETANIRRAGYTNVMTMNIALPIHDEMLLNEVPYVGILGTKNMLQRLWNQYMEGVLAGKLRQN